MRRYAEELKRKGERERDRRREKKFLDAGLVHELGQLR